MIAPAIRVYPAVMGTPSRRGASGLDDIDRRILASLQADATLSLTELAAKAGISTTPCWRRVQRLEREGYVARRVALLDRARLNVGVTVFVSIRAREHTVAWIEEFRAATRDISEIVDVYRMSGEIDYLIRAFVPDIAGYDALYKRLIGRAPLADVTSMFAMEELKSTTEVPLDFA